MDTPHMGCLYLGLGCILAVLFAAGYEHIMLLSPAARCIVVASVVIVPLSCILWRFREYIAFSLRTLVLAIFTLQLPMALILNAQNNRWAKTVGLVLLTVWLLVLLIYVVDLAIARSFRQDEKVSFEVEKQVQAKRPTPPSS